MWVQVSGTVTRTCQWPQANRALVCSFWDQEAKVAAVTRRGVPTPDFQVCLA